MASARQSCAVILLPNMQTGTVPSAPVHFHLTGGERVSKKKSIIDAAAFLFAEKGFYAATVEEIAIQAGIGKSTVYGYFPSKDQIFQEMLKYSFKIYMESMKGRLNPPYSLRDVLTDVATAHFKFNKEHPYIARILTNELGNYPLWAAELLQQLRERRISMLSSLLSQGIKLGEFRQLDPRLGAEVFLGILNALCMPIPYGISDEEGAEANVIEERFYRGIEIFFSGVSGQESALNVSV